jgi:alpha-tubulin suppressor-like RCC1 family protein
MKHYGTLAAGRRHTVGLKSDGTVTAVGDNKYDQCNVSGWHGIQLPGN